MTRVAMTVIAFYQRWVSPLGPPCCGYVPSCSAYAREALGRHGLWRGLGLAAQRLLRCHPLHRGGYDPVPATRGRRT